MTEGILFENFGRVYREKRISAAAQGRLRIQKQGVGAPCFCAVVHALRKQ